MIKLEMKQTEFIDMIKKMAIPIKSHQEPFLFPTIALTMRPDDEIEWIGRLKYIAVWVRVKCTIPIDISEPVQIPIEVSHFLNCLKTFKSKDLISFTHFTDQDDILTAERLNKNLKENIEYTFRKTTNPTIRGILEELPFRLEKGSDIILFKNGVVRPNISGSCDVSFFKGSIKPVKFIQKEKNKEKKIDGRSLYNIYIDGNLHQIKAVTGSKPSKNIIVDRLQNAKVNLLQNANVKGIGELHYTSGFAEVIDVLSGEIKFYAVDNGPLWIMQDTDQMKLRYLIAPTPIYRY